MAGKGEGSELSRELKQTLIEKYRVPLLENLTKEDLRELQGYLVRMVGEDRTQVPEYRGTFEFKLREYLHEGVLRKEFTTIETLLWNLTPEDLDRL